MLAEDLGGPLWLREKIGIAHRFFEFRKAIAAFGNE
jgi:hypothetical protein